MCGGTFSATKWLPWYHPGGYITLALDEESNSPYNVECQEPHQLPIKPIFKFKFSTGLQTGYNRCTVGSTVVYTTAGPMDTAVGPIVASHIVDYMAEHLAPTS